MIGKTNPELHDLLGQLRDRSEPWKGDHDAAMRCRDADDAATLAVAIFLAIDLVDINHRTAVLSGRVKHDPAEEATIEGMYLEWATSSVEIAAKVAASEANGHVVTMADAFKRMRREVAAMATPDSQHFNGPELVDMRDRAIDDHRNGLTAAFHEFGQKER